MPCFASSRSSCAELARANEGALLGAGWLFCLSGESDSPRAPRDASASASRLLRRRFLVASSSSPDSESEMAIDTTGDSARKGSASSRRVKRRGRDASGRSRGGAFARGGPRVASSSSHLAASSGEVRSTGAHAAPRAGLADGRSAGPGETTASRGQPVSSPVTSSLRQEGERGWSGRRWRVSASFRDETATRDTPRETRVREARTTRIPPRAAPRAAPLLCRRFPGPGATPPGPTAPRRERASSSRARAVVNFSVATFSGVSFVKVADRRLLPFTARRARMADRISQSTWSHWRSSSRFADESDSVTNASLFCRCPRRLRREPPCPHYERRTRTLAAPARLAFV